MNEKETMEYIEEINKGKSVLGLDNNHKLLEYLGNPQNDLKFIHIAGTNGKGSVCRAVSHVLTENGTRTGLFISPHLVCMEERMQINEQNSTKEQFVESFLTVKKAVERLQEAGGEHPSFFEYLFAMAMVFFAKEKVEAAVLETGLGGRLDATNIFTNILMITKTYFGLPKYFIKTIICTSSPSIAKKNIGTGIT